MKNFESEFQYKDPRYRSSILTNGLGKSGQRALLYATGMDEEDLKKPFVAVIGSFSEMVPGHTHLRELAECVCQGVIEAGGVPRRSETIAICDGLCQGHEGMRYPLASRDLIADSVEMVVEAHHFDAMVLLPGCDKIIPGMLMAAARLDIPAIVLPGGPMMPGNVGGNPLFCSSELREFPGRVEAGLITPDYMKAAERAALPTVGSCAHLGTANSMCMLTEVLGMALPGVGTAPAVSNRRKRLARASGRAVMECLKQGITPRKILTREGANAFINNFQDLYGMDQLPGLASQNMMADGIGYGAEGDWKVSGMTAIMKQMAQGLEGGTLFMEDYTYDLEPGKEVSLGAHMLEVCPSIAAQRPRIEVHPLGIGDRQPPARLVFEGKPGKGIVVSLIDMGGRLRMIIQDIEVIKPILAMPNLPVARVMWKPAPDLLTGVKCWIQAGGAHHTVLSTAVTAEMMQDWAEMMQIECVHITANTTVEEFKKELFYNDIAWKLKNI